mmetsp:Transcript_24892/g.81494  ORF Transcript_24892/g.81494 Transcript_24892/m.81494 type:complete len:377 (+) Transcript_24892:1101-2231(+)
MCECVCRVCVCCLIIGIYATYDHWWSCASSSLRSQSAALRSSSATSALSLMYSSTCGLSESSCSARSALFVFSAASFSSSTRAMSSSNLATCSVRSAVSRRSHAPSCVSCPSRFLSWLSTCTVLPVVSLSRRSSLFRSSIFSRNCWFSILSWSKSMACRTSPISSFCWSCCSSFWICALSVAFLSRSFSIIESFPSAVCSMYRSIFSATVLPDRKFSAPTTMSRLNSYVSFLISAMRRSVSSRRARSSPSWPSPSCLSCSTAAWSTSISAPAMSFFSSAVNVRVLGVSFRLPPFTLVFFFGSNSSSRASCGLTRSRYASNKRFSRCVCSTCFWSSSNTSSRSALSASPPRPILSYSPPLSRPEKKKKPAHRLPRAS